MLTPRKQGTPLHAMWTNGTFHEKSDYFVVHLSDALRLALVYKVKFDVKWGMPE